MDDPLISFLIPLFFVPPPLSHPAVDVDSSLLPLYQFSRHIRLLERERVPKTSPFSPPQDKGKAIIAMQRGQAEAKMHEARSSCGWLSQRHSCKAACQPGFPSFLVYEMAPTHTNST